MCRFIIAFLLSQLLTAATSLAEQPRLALLIGNQEYKGQIGALKNPHGDVDRVKASLERLGFRVRVVLDGQYKDMDVAVKQYTRELHDAGDNALGFFYYSGHGAANAKTQVNYLIPVDATSGGSDALWDQSIQQNEIVGRLSRDAGNATHFVVFDACRNELQLPAGGDKAIGLDKGFTAVQSASGVLIAYATAPNKTAADTGTFSAILAEELLRQGAEAAQVFRNVQIRVNEYMNQQPWLSYSAIPKTYFTASPEGPCNAMSFVAGGQEICRRPGDGQEFKDCEACPEMVAVPPGEAGFTGEYGFWEGWMHPFSQGPAIKVRIAKPLAISRSPVTFNEWDACVAAGGCAGYSPGDEGWGRGERPVVNASWNDANSYIAWLSKRTGQAYRLLSEAEREYVTENNGVGSGGCNCPEIRYTTTTITGPNGQMQSKAVAYEVPKGKTVPVRSYGPNDWGIYQVRGNADEWLEDCWNRTYAGMPDDGSAGKTGDCKRHVIRGMRVTWSFFLDPSFEYRWTAKAGVRDRFTSFRVARSLNR